MRILKQMSGAKNLKEQANKDQTCLNMKMRPAEVKKLLERIRELEGQIAKLEDDFEAESKGADDLENQVYDLKDKIKLVEGRIAEANKLVNDFPKRHDHTWIINNLDKAEEIEMDFRRIEKWFGRLRVALGEKQKTDSEAQMKTLKQYLLEIEHVTIEDITEAVKEWLQQPEMTLEKAIEELEQ